LVPVVRLGTNHQILQTLDLNRFFLAHI